MLVSFFSSNILVYIGKNPVNKLCKILEIDLKTYTPIGLKFFFEKNKFKFCIIFNMISFVNAQDSVKIRLACSKVLLLTISSSNIITHSNGDKYFCFYKSRCDKCSPETKLFTKQSGDTIQKDHIYHTKQYQIFYRKIKWDLLNFKGVKSGYHQNFQYLMVSIGFFHKMATLM